MRDTLRFLTLLACLLIALPAFAEALVVVEVRTPDGSAAEGTVTLEPRGGQPGAGRSYSCTTSGGSCRLDHVVGGMYTVRFAPTEGEAPAPRPAVIPPEGHVTLHVAAR